MKKLALIVAVVAAATVFCGTAVSNAQDRQWSRATVAQMEGMRRGEGQHKSDGDRNQLRRPAVIVVGVPVFLGAPYGSYYLAPPMDAYQTLDGFYYYCSEAAGYYPAVQDCPSGWTLVP